MQFIFGDNTSKYTLLYHDDPSGSAEQIKEMIRIPYSPSPLFDAIGYLPFGTNNSRLLVFRFAKDTKMVRNVYFLHGVYGEQDPAAYGTDAYLERIFTRFIDQTDFDALRDRLLAGEAAPALPITFDSGLMHAPKEEAGMDARVLAAILCRLYQRHPVRVVMDDDKFSPARVRLVLREIFRHLTPSLRKCCSFITAVEDTGTMEFLLKILPRSLKNEKESAIDLDAPQTVTEDKSFFGALATRLIAMTDGERDEVFDHYEHLYYGLDSLYRKQNFERLWRCFVLRELDGTPLEEYDALAGDYLMDAKCPATPRLPAFLVDALKEKYTADEAPDALIDWDSFAPERYLDFFDQHAEVLRKLYAIADPTLDYCRRRLEDKYVRTPYDGRQMEALSDSMRAFTALGAPEESGQCEQVFYRHVCSCCAHLLSVYRDFTSLVKTLVTETNDKLRERGANIVVSNMAGFAKRMRETVPEAMASLSARVAGLEEVLDAILISECLEVHNREVEQAMAEKAASEQASRLTDCLNAYIACLREQLDGMEAELPEIPTPRKPKRLADAEAASQAAPTPQKPTLQCPTEEEMRALAQDSALRPKLVQEIAAYVGTCVRRRSEDFFLRRDLYLSRAAYPAVAEAVTDALIRRGTPEVAILYLSQYGGDLFDAVQRMLNLACIEELTSEQLTVLKEFLPKITEIRAGLHPLEADRMETLSDIIRSNTYDSTKPAKTFGNILLACPGIAASKKTRMPQVSSGRIDRSSIIMMIGGVILLIAIIGLIVVIVKSQGDKDQSAGGESDTAAQVSGESAEPESDVTTGEDADLPGGDAAEESGSEASPDAPESETTGNTDTPESETTGDTDTPESETTGNTGTPESETTGDTESPENGTSEQTEAPESGATV